jgi:Ankyrin repeats (3 copies)
MFDLEDGAILEPQGYWQIFKNRSFLDSVEKAQSEKEAIEAIKNLSHGYDINYFDPGQKAQWRALHYAAYRGWENLVKLLLENGAQVDIVDAFGRTPLILVSNLTGYRIEIFLRLIHAGANIHAKDLRGENAIDNAKIEDDWIHEQLRNLLENIEKTLESLHSEKPLNQKELKNAFQNMKYDEFVKQFYTPEIANHDPYKSEREIYKIHYTYNEDSELNQLGENPDLDQIS